MATKIATRIKNILNGDEYLLNDVDVTALEAEIQEVKQNKQDKNDAELATANKTVVGAINEIHSRVMSSANQGGSAEKFYFYTTKGSHIVKQHMLFESLSKGVYRTFCKEKAEYSLAPDPYGTTCLVAFDETMVGNPTYDTLDQFKNSIIGVYKWGQDIDINTNAKVIIFGADADYINYLINTEESKREYPEAAGDVVVTVSSIWVSDKAPKELESATDQLKDDIVDLRAELDEKKQDKISRKLKTKNKNLVDAINELNGKIDNASNKSQITSFEERYNQQYLPIVKCLKTNIGAGSYAVLASESGVSTEPYNESSILVFKAGTGEDYKSLLTLYNNPNLLGIYSLGEEFSIEDGADIYMWTCTKEFLNYYKNNVPPTEIPNSDLFQNSGIWKTDNILIADKADENNLKEVISLIDTKQDKVDIRIKVADHSVVGAINELANKAGFQEVTYKELKDLRDQGLLSKGTQYRITDYVATTSAPDTVSANHKFDIIVIADNERTLNENARAINHEGDVYFANCCLAAWELKYCIDNDKSRFDWADEVNGKGVIYRMVDEWLNDVPYDFKSIQFTDSGTPIYTFGKNKDESLTGNSRGNEIGSNIGVGGQFLNNITFASISRDNKIGKNSYNNKFSGGCMYNTIGEGAVNNEFKGLLKHNVIGVNCSENTFRGTTQNNVIGNDFYNNTLSENFNDNVICGKCQNNYFGLRFEHNKVAQEFTDNTFVEYTYYNEFGINSKNNTFGERYQNNTSGSDFSYNEIGIGCLNNKFGNYFSGNKLSNSCVANEFGNEVQSIVINYSADDTNPLRYINVLSGTKDIELTGLAVNAAYSQKCGLNSNGEYVVKKELD